MATPVQQSSRFIYIDALRSFAILMMLQGHFISTTLASEFKTTGSSIYQFWEYFRGMTAPTFFTITGFIFVFLLLKHPVQGRKNPRIKKGLKRGLQLITWGYLLRISKEVFIGRLFPSFFYTDVLQIIGVSILFLCLLYFVCSKRASWLFSWLLLAATMVLFVTERAYNGIAIPYLPKELAHYFSQAGGAVFSIAPWFGYVSMGAFLATRFTKIQHQKNVRFTIATWLLIAAFVLLFYSSDVLVFIGNYTGFTSFSNAGNFNYLFPRLGAVFVLFSVFVLAEKWLTNPVFIRIGKVTLSIYIVHHVLLYGAWFHSGLNRWFANTLNFSEAIIGAILFLFTVCVLVLTGRDWVNTTANKGLEMLRNLPQTIRSYRA